MYFHLICFQINKKERVPVQCNLHHWSTKIADRLPFTTFNKENPIPIFPEQAELLKSMRGNTE